ncbi:MAG: hypothetical protein GX112_06330 [Clostridiaceae bacterium]|nr:hypothetical protein [Clostridiaceae bacterium]
MTASKSRPTQSRAKTRSGTGGGKTGRPRKRSGSLGRNLLDLLRLSWLGRVLLVALVIAAVIGLNILVSGNQYDRFFILTGIELVVTACAFWLRLVLRRS